MTSTLVQIARLFNMYFLAELSKLSVTQIIGHVAEPLLNIIRCDGWQSATHFDPIVERDLSFESLNGSEWIFTPLAQKEEPKIRSPRASQREKAATDRPQSKQALLYQWLSSNIEMNYASEVKRQQQAIIETRQRQAAFNTRNHHYQNIAGIIHDDTFPPSPPSVLTKKRKHGVYQEYNLNLLAEQATQMRGLPISPEISPSPPPFYHQQRLPSIKVMLSELHK
ncbi:uncharacterized protein EV154DRAFT_416053 [Mucor mucedo]|uniref:uncharacterized protein n=1 Tax=Mucor mucedo TaxID=29922 RepID=UPI00221F9856|nr:uncharacterized protein EV154DRAFT_416053 [Mucor mucedo]KAI7893912.1 hypothetical protein EV154DRAFT_416053 [Mucor mucedo]